MQYANQYYLDLLKPKTVAPGVSAPEIRPAATPEQFGSDDTLLNQALAKPADSQEPPSAQARSAVPQGFSSPVYQRALGIAPEQAAGQLAGQSAYNASQAVQPYQDPLGYAAGRSAYLASHGIR